jgi:hypothetical protein
MITAAAVAIGVVGVAAVLLAWRTSLLHRAAATWGWLAPVAAGSVVALAAVGASGPLRSRPAGPPLLTCRRVPARPARWQPAARWRSPRTPGAEQHNETPPRERR